MKNLPAALLLTLLVISAFSCNNSKSSETAAPSDSAAITLPDSVSVEENIVWRAVQGMPVTDTDLDTIVAYFEKADRWTALHLAKVNTKAEFDSIEAEYTRVFPMMEMFSAILEDYAAQISPEQMQRLEATAVSMGKSVDQAARRAGIEPSEVNPLHTTQTPADSI